MTFNFRYVYKIAVDIYKYKIIIMLNKYHSFHLTTAEFRLF